MVEKVVAAMAKVIPDALDSHVVQGCGCSWPWCVAVLVALLCWLCGNRVVPACLGMAMSWCFWRGGGRVLEIERPRRVRRGGDVVAEAQLRIHSRGGGAAEAERWRRSGGCGVAVAERRWPWSCDAGNWGDIEHSRRSCGGGDVAAEPWQRSRGGRALAAEPWQRSRGGRSTERQK